MKGPLFGGLPLSVIAEKTSFGIPFPEFLTKDFTEYSGNMALTKPGVLFNCLEEEWTVISGPDCCNPRILVRVFHFSHFPVLSNCNLME